MQNIMEDEAGNLWVDDGRGGYQPYSAPQSGQGGGPSPFTVGSPRYDPKAQYEGPRAATDLEGASLDNSATRLQIQLAEAKVAEERRKVDEEAAKRGAADDARGQAVHQLISTIEAARKASGLSRDGWFATGLGAKSAREWGGTSAANVKSLLDTVGGNAAFDQLQRMRAASPTGGALGGVSAPELDMLKSSIAALDQTQDDNQFQGQMGRIVEVYGDILARVAPEEAQRLGVQSISAARPNAGLGAQQQGQASLLQPQGLPRASGAQASAPAQTDGVVASHRGGITQVPSLAGIDQGVIDMIGQGASTHDVLRELSKAYDQTELDHGGRVKISPEMGAFVGDLIERHRANPSAPVRSLTTGWEMLSGYETPDQGGGALNTLANPSKWLGAAADTTLGNFAMNAANGAAAGLPAYLAGGEGEGVIAAARQERPVSSIGGDLAGTLGGLMAGNRLLAGAGATGAKIANFGQGVATDVAHQATRGGLENGPEGALMMGGAALAGNLVGRYAVAPAAVAAASTAPGKALINFAGKGANALGNAGRGLFGQTPRSYSPVNIPSALPHSQRAVLGRLPDDATAQLREAAELGMPLSLADLSPKLQALTGSVARKSENAGELAKRTFDGRGLGQEPRLQSQIGRHFGPIENPDKISEQLIEQARREAGPLYDAAYAQPPVNTPNLESLLGTPFSRGAVGRANHIAANERRDPRSMGFARDEHGEVVLNAAPVKEMDALQSAREGWDSANAQLQAATRAREASLTPSAFTKQVRDAEAALTTATNNLEAAKTAMRAMPSGGSTQLTPGYSPQTLDYVKRGMDDDLEKYRNLITHKLELDEAGKAENDVLREFLKEVDAQNPLYAQARAAYGGPASMKTTLGAGRDAWGLDPRQISTQMDGYSPQHTEMYRLGARSSLSDSAKSAKFTADPYRKVFGSPEAHERAATIFGQDATDGFARASQIERRMAETAHEVSGGSATARRASADDAFDTLAGQAADVGGALVFGGGGLQEMVKALSRGARDNWRLRGSQRAADEMAPLLIPPQPAEMARRIEELAAQSAARNVYVQGARKRVGIFGSSLGAAGRPFIQ